VAVVSLSGRRLTQSQQGLVAWDVVPARNATNSTASSLDGLFDESLADTVKENIANQREHHRRQSFETEYLGFLQKHGIEYDPQYVFEMEIVA
jgi:hypothetical protein